MLIRIMEMCDLPAVVSIQAAAPQIAQWSAADYQRFTGPSTGGWIVECDGALSGFMVARIVLDEAEILNLAVDPALRRRGIGSLLLQTFCKYGQQQGVARIHLEVRESNRPAIDFYKRNDFSVSGRRPHYYASPAEDALLLSAQIRPLAR